MHGELAIFNVLQEISKFRNSMFQHVRHDISEVQDEGIGNPALQSVGSCDLRR